VAVDATGTACDVPAVLMTRLAGRPRRRPDVRRLAEVLSVIHAVRVPAHVRVRPYSPYYLDRDLRPPPWTRLPAAWARAIDVHHGRPPDDPPVFIHRDYHPGNVLWSGGLVTGVVDWVNAGIGGAGADVGHCRVNLCAFGQDVAERFLDLWLRAAGVDSYHPYWDIVAAVGLLPEHSAPPVDPRRLDGFVARAVARL